MVNSLWNFAGLFTIFFLLHNIRRWLNSPAEYLPLNIYHIPFTKLYALSLIFYFHQMKLIYCLTICMAMVSFCFSQKMPASQGTKKTDTATKHIQPGLIKASPKPY